MLTDEWPAPLSDNLASVYLRPETNNPAYGFIFGINATLGSDIISVDCEGEHGKRMGLRCDISITQCNIDLEYINCNIIDIPFDGDDEPEISISDVSEISGKNTKSQNVTVEGELSNQNKSFVLRGKGKSGIQKGASIGESTSYTQSMLAKRKLYCMKTKNTIEICWPESNFKKTKRELTGRIIKDFKPLKLTPQNNDNDYGVIARIIVKESWINISNVELSGQNSIIQSVKHQISQSSKKRFAFDILVRHLVHRNLSSRKDARVEACVAIHGCIYNPKEGSDGDFLQLLSDKPFLMPPINLEAIISLAEAPESEIDNVMRNAGVSNDLIASISSDNNVVATQPENAVQGDLNPELWPFPHWSKIAQIPTGALSIDEWRKCYSIPDGNGTELSLEEIYLNSLLAFPTVPHDHWINICLYSKYTHDDYDDFDLAKKLGRRLANCDRLSIEDFKNIFAVVFAADDDLDYASGSWMIVNFGIMNTYLEKENDTVYQFATCLDHAADIISNLDINIIHSTFKNILADVNINVHNKILLFAILYESRLFDKILLDHIGSVQSSYAPAFQAGLINAISKRTGTVGLIAHRNVLVIEAAKRCHQWLVQMAPIYNRDIVSLDSFVATVTDSFEQATNLPPLVDEAKK